MSKKLERLSQAGQIALIVSINQCISYCYDRKTLKDVDEERFKVILSKIIGSYRNVFKLSWKCYSKANLKMLFECTKISEITFMCREFLRENNLTERSADYNLIFLELFVTTLPNENIQTNWISYLQIFARRFMKFPKHSDILNGLGHIFKTISIIRTRNNSEISQQLLKLTNELYPFLSNHPYIIDALISNDLFFGMELDFFRSVKLENNLTDSFKNCIKKRLNQGSILVEEGDLFDLYMKLEFGDFNDFESQKLPAIFDSDFISYEVFSRLAVQNSTDLAIESLLKLWSQSYFISDPRNQVKFMNLLKISLLSQTSDSLGETLKRFFIGPLTVSSLCLLTCFPFSLWRSLEKSSVKQIKLGLIIIFLGHF